MKKNNQPLFEPDRIEKQLQNILSSRLFRNAHVLSIFLRFVTEQTLAGQMNMIKEYSIATQVLGRSVDFNPQADAVVRIHAGRLRKLLAEYYRLEGAGDDIFIEIPKGSYVPLFSINSTNGATDRSLGRLSAQTARENIQQRKVALAVLPFQDLSAENPDNYFVETLGEQLCIDLAKFQHLSVISYYSMPQGSREKTAAKDVSKMYDVDYVLTGNIRFSNKTIQIDIQFVCAVTGIIAWAHSFSEPFALGNLYAVQDRVIEHVLNRIADVDGLITKSVVNGPLTHRKDAFGVYFSVYQYFAGRGKNDHNACRQTKLSLEEATARDPENALLWSVLANLYLNCYVLQTEKNVRDLERGRECAERAIWLDRNCQHAFEAMAWLHLLTGKKDDCIDAIERCLDLNPRSVSVAGDMGFLLTCLGKYQQAFRLFSKSSQLNVVAPCCVGMGYALYYYNSKDYESALDWINRPIIPEFPLKVLVREATNKKINDQQNNARGNRKAGETQMAGIEQPGDILNQYILDHQLKESLLEGLLV